MLVAPLLAFLADAVFEGNDAVISQAVDKRFGDIGAGRYGADAGQVGHGVDDIAGGGVLVHIALADRDDGDGSSFDLRCFADAGDDDFTGFDGGEAELYVELGNRRKVYVLVEGGIADITDFNEVNPFGGQGNRKFAIGIGDGTGLHIRDGDGGAGDRFAVSLIGNGAGQGAELRSGVCQQGLKAKNTCQKEGE